MAVIQISVGLLVSEMLMTETPLCATVLIGVLMNVQWSCGPARTVA